LISQNEEYLLLITFYFYFHLPGNFEPKTFELVYTPYFTMNWKSPTAITYLANSELQCPENQLLNSFQFEHLEKKKFRYKYECGARRSLQLEYKNVTNNWSAYLGWVSNPGDRLGNVNFLDRQTVDCTGKGFLTSVYMEVDFDTEHLRYIYTCGKPISVALEAYKCNDHHTQKYDSEDYRLPALEHHFIKCNKNEFLVKFFLRVDYEAPRGNVWYNYTCCSIPAY
jgi:hypothetical protein